MFRALLAHPQEALHNGTWYIECVLCQLSAPGLERNWCMRHLFFNKLNKSASRWFHYTEL
jgi:hypothetical protein